MLGLGFRSVVVVAVLAVDIHDLLCSLEHNQTAICYTAVLD